MTDRPILRLPSPTASARLKGRPDPRPRPRGAGRQGQGARFEDQFARLEEALTGENTEVVLRQDPSGIAPERALVFETAVPITNFKKAADRIELEVLIETSLDENYELPEELVDEYVANASPTLYATMPSTQDLDRLLSLWRSFQRNEKAAYGLAPWWKLFEMLADLRLWGPQDRLTPEAQAELAARLPEDDTQAVRLELEIWPTANAAQRARWQQDTRVRVEALGGRVVASSSINENGFIYEAALIDMPSGAVRTMLENPFAPNGLAMIEGLQFVLPQTIAQSLPDLSDSAPDSDFQHLAPFDGDAPIRAVLLDGTPIAGHPALDGGVIIEDVHDLVRLSQVQHRRHATSMASLILRGDLIADATPVDDSRLLSIPVLIDDENGATSPDDRLFVDIVHVALTQAFVGAEAFAPSAFLVNFSIGVKGAHFAGRISSLARMLDWWADQHGVLFLVSAGNVPEDLVVPDITSTTFEDLSAAQRRNLVAEALRNSRHSRTLMAPSEAMNVLTVGGSSEDLTDPAAPAPPAEIELETANEILPALSSAVGLGAFRSIKPDLLCTAGRHDIRMRPAGADLRLGIVGTTQRTGLNVATVTRGIPSVYRTRGTSCANALTSRAHLISAAALTSVDGPFEGQELGRRDLGLITKALSINAARWTNQAFAMFDSEKARVGSSRHAQAREETCRYFGHGILHSAYMREAPELGATLVGTGTIKKDQGAIFDVPLPPSLAGERIGRTMWVTIAWFSPVLATRARYRLAALEAVASGEDLLGDPIPDYGWALDMAAGHLDANIIKRGTVWSRRLIHNGSTVPNYAEGKVLPVRVQCRDASGGGLSPDDEIRFAIAVTLELEAEAQFDIQVELQDELRIRARAGRP
jgi:hypothetical protein